MNTAVIISVEERNTTYVTCSLDQDKLILSKSKQGYHYTKHLEVLLDSTYFTFFFENELFK